MSPILGLELRIVDDELRLWDPVAGRLLEKSTEIAARVRELEEELLRLRGGTGA